MGNAESTHYKNMIDCGDKVTHRDINAAVDRTNCCTKDRQLLQHARVVATREPEWVRRNMCITCYGEHIEYNFVSGAKTNEYVVQLNGHGEICSDWASKGWTLWAHDEVCKIWKLTKEAVIPAINSFYDPISAIMNQAKQALSWKE